eukprot:g1074.t1
MIRRAVLVVRVYTLVAMICCDYCAWCAASDALDTSFQGGVPRIVWPFSKNKGEDGERSFARRAVSRAGGRPLVIESSPAVDWNVSSWTPESMHTRVSPNLVIPVKQKSDGAKFNLGCCVPRRVSASSFLRMIPSVAAHGEYAYFAGPIEYLGETFKQDVDIDIFDTQEVSRDSPYCTEGDDQACLKTTVWIGSAGATTPCHHDEMHNFFLQVYGRKRFVLFPPSAWRELRLFPKYHQMHRNVRVDIDADTPFSVPTARPHHHRQEVILSPGDVLYLPPLWFHEVEALSEASISVNVWSASRWMKDVARLWDANLPLALDFEDVGALVVELGAYVYTIIDTVLSSTTGESPKHFLRSLLGSRYAAESEVEGDAARSRRMHKDSMESALHEAYIRRVERDSPSFVARAGFGESASRHIAQWCDASVMRSANTIRRHLRSATSARDLLLNATRAVAASSSPGRDASAWTTGAIEIYLAHYLEDVSSQAVGFSNVAQFLAECVRDDEAVTDMASGTDKVNVEDVSSQDEKGGTRNEMDPSDKSKENGTKSDDAMDVDADKRGKADAKNNTETPSVETGANNVSSNPGATDDGGEKEKAVKKETSDETKRARGSLHRPRITWQKKEDRQDRITMIHQIVRLLRQKKPNAPQQWLKKLPDMARRLEDTLYRLAQNKDEYMNLKTLKPRLQSVAIKMGARVERKRNLQRARAQSQLVKERAGATKPGASSGKSSADGSSSRRFVNIGDINPAASVKKESDAANSSDSGSKNGLGKRKLDSASSVGGDAKKSKTDEDAAKAKRMLQRKQRAHLLKQQQQRLLLLCHASKCKAKGECKVTKLCTQMKWLWQHITKCKDKHCQVAHCVSSRYVLTHYHQCHDPKCQVCHPVRVALQKQMHARNPARKKPLDKEKLKKLREKREKEKEKRRKRMANVVHCLTVDQLDALFDSLQTDFNPFYTTKVMKKRFEPVMLRILEQDFGWIFAEPVDPEKHGLKNYREIITRPMDLGTIRKKMSRGLYKTPQKFYADVKLTFDNAMTFNPEGTDVHDIAKRFMEQFDKDFDDTMEKVRLEEQQQREKSSACTMCGGEKFTFEPQVYYCNRCAQKIRRNSHFYTTQDNKAHYCHSCWTHYLKPEFEFNGNMIRKADLSKRKNDKVEQEAWVQCDKCDGWLHQICCMFNNRNNSSDSSVKYTCPHCVRKSLREKGSEGPLDTSNVYQDADRLPENIFSKFLQERINSFIERSEMEMSTEIKAPTARRGRSSSAPSPTPVKIPPITLRVLSSHTQSCHTRDNIQKWFAKESDGAIPQFPDGFPTSFPHKAKAMLIFQKQDGIDVCLFGLYVQEYGDDCPEPNRRKCYISYLDSVKYFQPSRLRTAFYKDLLIGYLAYTRKRGFTHCYIWSCPPKKGDDYIMYCHPPDQKTPKSDRLRAWYVDIIEKARKEGLVVDRSNIVDYHLAVDTSIGSLPYFDGDYWPGEAEAILGELMKEKEKKTDKKTGGKKSAKKKSTAPSKTKKRGSARAAAKAAAAAESSAALLQTAAVQKLRDVLEKMKEDFIVVQMHHQCRKCNEYQINGKIWVDLTTRANYANELSFAFCDKCYQKEVAKLTKRQREELESVLEEERKRMEEEDMPKPLEVTDDAAQKPSATKSGAASASSSKSKEKLTTLGRLKRMRMEVVECSESTKDPDPEITSSMFNTRRDFLHLCQGNHYQFDELRRAKHSTMMLLYHLHNPDEDAFVYSCNTCHETIKGDRYHCDVCADFDLCHRCARKHGGNHQHKLTCIRAGRIDEEARKERMRQIRLHVGLLVHACSCVSKNCVSNNCKKMKALLNHVRVCKQRTQGGCNICRRMWTLVHLHARQCHSPKCRVPRCVQIRAYLRKQQLQADERRRSSYRAVRNEERAAASGSSRSSTSSRSGRGRGTKNTRGRGRGRKGRGKGKDMKKKKK